MRGRRYPRNRSSSPSMVLNRNITRIRPYQPKAPSRNALPASDSRIVANSRSSGAGTIASSSCAKVNARISGITTSHTRPPTRPLRGLRGERSQSASRTVDQRRVRCSRPTRIATRTNCQTMPIARETISAFAIGTSPTPAKRSASAGATSQASTAIGSAAAAQTARIPRIRSCGISTLETAASERAVAVSGYETLICVLLWGSIPVPDAKRRWRQAPRRKAGFGLRLADDSGSYSGRRRLQRACGTFSPMSRIRYVAREYWFELLIAFLAIAGMLELVVGRDSPGAPPTSLWFATPTVAVLVLPLFARRRFPFAAPAAYWVLVAVISFGDGVLLAFIGSLALVGLASAFLLGNLRDPLKAGAGLVIVLVGIVI